MRLSALYRQQQIAIGLMDLGTKEELFSSIEWYLENVNAPLYVITTEYRLSEDDFTTSYSNVSFIIFHNAQTTGTYINVFSNECNATYFLVVSSECELISFDGARLMKIMEGKGHPVAIAPIMLSAQGEILPTIRAPYLRGKEVDPVSFTPKKDSGKPEDTLYPLMELGFYDRALFQRLKCYDPYIIGDYYQALDFGVRCYLLGYSIVTVDAFVIMFPNKVSIIEDRSECTGMKRFYTKALSIRKISGKNVAEKYKPYFDKEVFNEEVKKKQLLLQKTDFFSLIEHWKTAD